MRPALFLDRDGVINVDHGYVHTPEKTEFVPGIFELVATANRHGWLVVVVTNQAGIARGYYDEAQFGHYMDWMRQQFEQRGARIDAVYFCPHHPEHGQGAYLQQCDCRKPAPGMLLEAIESHDIDRAASVMVGDTLTDMQAARAAGVGTLLWLTEAPGGAQGLPLTVIRDLREVIPRILASA
ncbi:D-glycero-beta-D-manno-heptose 1,7-bisphosphate 7-phosphatase [Xenophilus arseniciresistens]|uniref:D,D-heptose 1,7-bisphosphate phosphatase n=1 Tax=Xenophilus arseniciresistens TaxID=1283306 RepID=A0AAE3NBE1_9BURK|nr:D-glycero-beta-D-manno-heptose 1,7-bisphosphate 7-phosphatase [Xenophilus arseniciresistens]MDA7417776.1 D-glycero-beta-D-manno-heptose 1,7-bisphosphate 7-phosphatase [Xenophilus arseniciresistens]